MQEGPETLPQSAALTTDPLVLDGTSEDTGLRASLVLIVCKQVRVKRLDRKGLFCADPKVMLDHEARQLVAIHQDDVLLAGIVDGLFGEGRRGHKQTLATPSRNCTDESLHVRTADRVIGIPSLDLHVDQIKPQLILHDDAVDSLVACKGRRDGGVP